MASNAGTVHQFDPHNTDMCFVTVTVAPGRNGHRYLCNDGTLWTTCIPSWEPNDSIPHNGYFPTRAAAEFALALYQDPRTALSAFLAATGGEYEGSCPDCLGSGRPEGKATTYTAGRREDITFLCTTCGEVIAVPRGVEPITRATCPKCPCPTCSGTGGPPARAGEVADWYESAGDEMRAEVLRGLAK